MEHPDESASGGTARRLTALAVLVLAAAVRLWRLGQNGYDNEYYAAAVRSMSQSWHNFLYNAFDPAGFVSVDKPPGALWIQVASVKLLGFHGWSVLLPQVLEGVASVALVYHLVQRRFGAAAGLLAALFLALTPVNVAVDRSANTESCLALVLLLAAWALLTAAELGSRWRLLLTMALVGVGFNVKMLAAFVVLPTFALVYALGAPVGWRRRLVDLGLGAAVLVVVSFPWMLAYDLTAPENRPFVGSTKQNTMAELAFGHNAVGRFVRPATITRSPRVAADAGSVTPRGDNLAASGDATLPVAVVRVFVRAPVGPLRLADGQLAGQASWLLPLALAGFLGGMLQTGLRRTPLSPAQLSLTLWFGWALTYAVVYSYAGGIFHFYYLSTMAPALAALAGIGVVKLWRLYDERRWTAVLLPLTLLATAAWQAHVETKALGWTHGDWLRWLHLGMVALSVVAASTLVLLSMVKRPPIVLARRLGASALAVGLVALLLLPVAWSLSSVLVRGVPVLPSADLLRLRPEYGSPDGRERARLLEQSNVRKLIGFLQQNRHGERYLLATSSTRMAAPVIIETGEPVMAMGGFHGLDPILTPEKLGQLIDTGQVRFVMLGDLSYTSRRLGGDVAGRSIADWVRARGTPVEPDLWRADIPRGAVSRRTAGRISAMQLYDLKPDAASPAGASTRGR